MGVCHQEGVSVEQGHVACLSSWSLQEEQVDLLQNRLQPRWALYGGWALYGKWALGGHYMENMGIVYIVTINICHDCIAPGCSQCHRGNTISDWRDPLDPDLDAQVIYSQFIQGRSMLIKKYLPVLEEDGNSSMRDGSTSPTSMTSSGATSLQDQEGGATSLSAAGQSVMEDYCRDLMEILDGISWHHSQIRVP